MPLGSPDWQNQPAENKHIPKATGTTSDIFPCSTRPRQRGNDLLSTPHLNFVAANLPTFGLSYSSLRKICVVV